jgi:hypothetical protein
MLTSCEQTALSIYLSCSSSNHLQTNRLGSKPRPLSSHTLLKASLRLMVVTTAPQVGEESLTRYWLPTSCQAFLLTCHRMGFPIAYASLTFVPHPGGVFTSCLRPQITHLPSNQLVGLDITADVRTAPWGYLIKLAGMEPWAQTPGDLFT